MPRGVRARLSIKSTTVKGICVTVIRKLNILAPTTIKYNEPTVLIVAHVASLNIFIVKSPLRKISMITKITPTAALSVAVKNPKYKPVIMIAKIKKIGITLQIATSLSFKGIFSP